MVSQKTEPNHAQMSASKKRPGPLAKPIDTTLMPYVYQTQRILGASKAAQYKWTHPEFRERQLAYKREYHKKHREEELKKRHAYYRKNAERLKQWTRDWRKRNKERVILSKRAWHKKNKHRDHGYSLKSKYGMTEEQYEEMYYRQDGGCAICKRKIKLVVDHDHRTGEIRGLLCQTCNVLIGYLQKHIEDMPLALRYLKMNARQAENVSEPFRRYSKPTGKRHIELKEDDYIPAVASSVQV